MTDKEKLGQADKIITEYALPNSLVDNGNLFFAATEYANGFEEACELLEELKGWARTYAMQTYSKAASRDADAVDDFLERVGRCKETK